MTDFCYVLINRSLAFRNQLPHWFAISLANSSFKFCRSVVRLLSLSSKSSKWCITFIFLLRGIRFPLSGSPSGRRCTSVRRLKSLTLHLLKVILQIPFDCLAECIGQGTMMMMMMTMECGVTLPSCSSTTESMSKWNLIVLVFLEEGKSAKLAINSRSNYENKQKNNPTCEDTSGNHHCATSTPQAFNITNWSAFFLYRWGVLPK